MTLTSKWPLNKVSAATLATALAALVLWALRRYAGMDTEGATVISSFVMVLFTFLAGYLTPLSEDEVDQIVQAPDAPVQMPNVEAPPSVPYPRTIVEARVSASETVSDAFKAWMSAEQSGDREEAAKKQHMYDLLRDARKKMDEEPQP